MLEVQSGNLPGSSKYDEEPRAIVIVCVFCFVCYNSEVHFPSSLGILSSMFPSNKKCSSLSLCSCFNMRTEEGEGRGGEGTLRSMAMT
jgi:hypothetical protein